MTNGFVYWKNISEMIIAKKSEIVLLYQIFRKGFNIV